MGGKTLAALKDAGASTSTRLEARRSSTRARSTAVEGVSLMEFGTPEAMWHLAVTDFAIAAQWDAHGNSLHKDIEQESARSSPHWPNCCSTAV